MSLALGRAARGVALARGAALPRAWRPILMLAALFAALAVRMQIGLATTTAAMAASTVFGAALIAVALAAGWRPRPPRPAAIALGMVGGAALIALAMIFRSQPALSFATHPEPVAVWLVILAVVVVGEEAILRGVLFDTCRDLGGLPLAIVVTSVAFALIHVPLYGWYVVPLDLAVGVFLAGLRVWSRGVAAPAVAHAVADLATWWL